METAPETARDYVLGRARCLADQLAAFNAMPVDERALAICEGRFSLADWAGRAAAVLKEITRDA